MAYKAFVSYSHAADDRLAPMLQSSLQRFAKPFYKLRAIDVFRDKTSLHLTPELWPEIQKAIGRSEFFILLASPDSAQSQWVRKEVDEWLRLRGGGIVNFLIVLTGGSLEWDDDANDFDWERTDALPPNLRGKFRSEPFFSDLRWVNKSEELSLRHPQFLDEVGTLAAALHGRPKDTMIGEDVKQHRVVKVTAAAAIALLLILAAGASVAAYVATKQRARAEEQTNVAREQRGVAEKQTTIAQGQSFIAETRRREAEDQTKIAKKQTELAEESARQEKIAKTNAERAAELEKQARIEAETNLRMATARQLAAQSGQSLISTHASVVIGADDPQRGALLALESLGRAQTPEGTRALRQALATLAGQNQPPPFVQGQTLILRELGPKGEWARATLDHEEVGDVLLDPRTGTRLDKNVVKVPDAPERKSGQDLEPDVTASAFGSRGDWRVTLSKSGVISVWDVVAKRVVAQKQSGADVSSLAISDDGALVAAGSQNSVRVWQVKGWRRIADLPHEWSLQGMAFSSGGHWLTTVTGNVSADAAVPGETALVGSTVRVWSVRERRLVTQESLAAHGGITSVAFTPDGLWLAVTSPAYYVPDTPEAVSDAVGVGGTTLRLWQLTPDDLRRTACGKLKRNLTASEWDTFIGTKPRGRTCPGLPTPVE
jgi:MTH538 TIR-like domain (DUF1863)/WD domain, G-beta repeat